MERSNQAITFTYSPSELHYTGPVNDLYTINSPILCNIGLHSNERFTYHIKAGFATNFRSGPKFLDRYIDRIGAPPLALSWIVHDVNYEGYLSRKRADLLLYFMLLDAGIERAKCETVYMGLRLFGNRNYEDTRSNAFIDFSHTIQAPHQWLERTKDVTFLEGLDLNVDMGAHFAGSQTSALDEELIFDNENYEEVRTEMLEIARANHLDLNLTDLNNHYQ